MMNATNEAVPPEVDGTHMAMPQSVWRFDLGSDCALRERGSYTVRQALKTTLNRDLQDVTVRFSAQSMTMTSRTPESSRWMQANMSRLFAAVADQAGQMLAVDLNDTVPLCEKFADAAQTLYAIPRLVVANAKRSCDWEAWRQPELTPEQMAQIQQVIAADLVKELKVWGIHVDQPGVVVIDGGRPMPIVQGDGPRAMARLGVKFISPWHLDGEFFVGKLTPMGFGVIKRGGKVAQSAPLNQN